MGDIKGKEASILTLTSSGASLTNGSGGAAGTDMDCRSGGNAAQHLRAQFELTCQWSTITGIVKDTVAAMLYLVPKLNGTNAPDVDTTAGSSAFPQPCFIDVFSCVKAPTSNTNMILVTNVVELSPKLYTAYVLNKSGQTISANWTLKVVPEMAQYT